MNTRTTQGGSSMVEVLVTVVVVSFSLLSFAGLMARSMSENRTAYWRSQATFLTYGIIECMRVNRQSAIAHAYDVDRGEMRHGTSVADVDVNDWKTQLSEVLPNGDGQIRVEGDGNVIVTLEWEERGDGMVTIFRTESAL